LAKGWVPNEERILTEILAASCTACALPRPGKPG
jgi:hypothetical protein